MARLRLATFNLLHGLGVEAGAVREGELYDAAVRLDADLLSLQEVDRGQPRSGKTDQAAVVADALDAPWWRFAPALSGVPGQRWSPASPMSDPAGPAYGIALVSRLRVLHWRARSFPAAPVILPLKVAHRRGLTLVRDEPRVALAAVVVGPDGPFTVAATHLSFVPGWNVRQLRATVRWLAPMPAPRVLLGDLNLPGAVPHVLTGWSDLGRTPTYPSWRPRVQWDHVISRGIGHDAVRGVAALRQPVSDHCALVVDVEL
ncbi:MAG: endonuclease/exonuclease/phosphatase family protein [Jiangellaceae bacterium]